MSSSRKKATQTRTSTSVLAHFLKLSFGVLSGNNSTKFDDALPPTARHVLIISAHSTDKTNIQREIPRGIQNISRPLHPSVPTARKCRCVTAVNLKHPKKRKGRIIYRDSAVCFGSCRHNLPNNRHLYNSQHNTDLPSLIDSVPSSSRSTHPKLSKTLQNSQYTKKRTKAVQDKDKAKHAHRC